MQGLFPLFGQKPTKISSIRVISIISKATIDDSSLNLNNKLLLGVHTCMQAMTKVCWCGPSLTNLTSDCWEKKEHDLNVRNMCSINRQYRQTSWLCQYHHEHGASQRNLSIISIDSCNKITWDTKLDFVLLNACSICNKSCVINDYITDYDFNIFMATTTFVTFVLIVIISIISQGYIPLVEEL